MELLPGHVYHSFVRELDNNPLRSHILPNTVPCRMDFGCLPCPLVYNWQQYFQFYYFTNERCCLEHVHCCHRTSFSYHPLMVSKRTLASRKRRSARNKSVLLSKRQFRPWQRRKYMGNNGRNVINLQKFDHGINFSQEEQRAFVGIGARSFQPPYEGSCCTRIS